MISINDQEFKELTKYIQEHYGINLQQKRHLIEGRLNNVLMEKGFDNFSEYFRYCFCDPSKLEITSLVNKLTTNYTFFMREYSHFDYFQEKVLPFLKTSVKKRDIRIWSAGCSSGAEPYTLAMIMADYFESEKSLWDTKVLATDISVDALGIAEKGVYSAEQLQEVPLAWKLNYFRQTSGQEYQVAAKLRGEVIFRIFNLMDAFPFKQKFHVIFCRNVMIYFDNETKNQLVNKFYDLTEPGGYLFIGHTESIGRYETPYQYVMPAVYRKG